MTPDSPSRTGLLDTATVILAVTGVLCGNLIDPRDNAQNGQVALIFGSLTIILGVFRERRATRRDDSVRHIAPGPKHLAGSGAVLLLAAALGAYTADRQDYGWLGFGFFLSGAAMALQFLITRKPRPDASLPPPA